MSRAPYLPGLLTDVLRPAMAALARPASVFTQLVLTTVDQAPCVVVSVLPGGVRVDPRFPAVTESVQVDCYDRETGFGSKDETVRAQLLAEQAGEALYAAVRRVSANGSIVSLRTTAVPTERREAGQPDRVSRWRAIYSITADA